MSSRIEKSRFLYPTLSFIGSFVMVSRKSPLLWRLGDLGNHQPLGCRTDGVINRCMSSVSGTSGPDTELQVSDKILQNFGMKTSFSKDVPKLPITSIYLVKYSPTTPALLDLHHLGA